MSVKPCAGRSASVQPPGLAVIRSRRPLVVTQPAELLRKEPKSRTGMLNKSALGPRRSMACSAQSWWTPSTLFSRTLPVLASTPTS
jgi:hypothetical protein